MALRGVLTPTKFGDITATGVVDFSGASSVDLGTADGANLTLSGTFSFTGGSDINGASGNIFLNTSSVNRDPVFRAVTTEVSRIDMNDGSYIFVNGVKVMSGSGSPEGSKTAPVGSTYGRSDGGAGTSFYVKESGTGNTGWVAK
jgi:hypothetical protein